MMTTEMKNKISAKTITHLIMNTLFLSFICLLSFVLVTFSTWMDDDIYSLIRGIVATYSR
jgi:hypothetical protein